MSKLNINKKIFTLAALTSMALFTGCASGNETEIENTETVASDESIEKEETLVEEVDNSVESHFHVHIYEGDTIIVFRECDGYIVKYDYNTGSGSMYQALEVYDEDTMDRLYEYRGTSQNCTKHLICDEEVEDFFQEIESKENYKIYKKTK